MSTNAAEPQCSSRHPCSLDTFGRGSSTYLLFYLAETARAVNCAERLQLCCHSVPIYWAGTDNEEQANPGLGSTAPATAPPPVALEEGNKGVLPGIVYIRGTLINDNRRGGEFCINWTDTEMKNELHRHSVPRTPNGILIRFGN